AYMAPEQARGKLVDKRADIWAFGVVVSEMVTGRRMFEGDSISDTLAGVLTKAPDWTGVPVAVQRLLKSCLEKDPRQRLRDIGDVWRLLDNAPARASANRVALLPWAIAGLSLLAVSVALWSPWRGAIGSTEHSRTALDFDLGPDASFGPTIG